MSENRSSKAKFIWITLLIGVIAIPISLLILVGMGQHAGQEFSPDDFSRRAFQYNQVPGLNWVLFNKAYTDETTALEQDLVADKLINPVINKTKTWHLVWDSGDNNALASYECDARFLTEYLDLTDEEGENYWILWNEKFPESAKVFWSRVAELARDEMYLKIADVMQTAMEVDSDEPVKFQSLLDHLTANVYLELGTLDLELGRLERAHHRLDRSIEIIPSREAYQNRSECLKKLGKLTESNQDRESAKSAALISVDSPMDKEN